MEPNINEEITVFQLWQELNFDGKHHYDLTDQGEIVLRIPEAQRPNGVFISKLNVASFGITIAALQQKFDDIVTEVNALNTDWDQAEDKLKLVGKLEKFKDYLYNAKALGNIVPLMSELNVKHQHIQNIYKENFALRLALVEKAEALQQEEDLKVANQGFKDLIDTWRTAAPIEKNKLDELWLRIENARNVFFDKKRAFQENYEKQMLENLDWKLELCEKAEALIHSEEWKDTTEKFKQLTESWKGIGRVVSQEKNEELWTRFITAQNYFFEKKRQHFELINVEQEQNLQQKLAIVSQIEAIDLSNCSWKETSDRIAEWTEQWKLIGRVPKEQSDEIWNRFQESKNRFYDAKRKFTEQHRLTLEDNLAKKQALINRIEKIKHSSQWRETTLEVNNLMAEWKSLGPVPREMSNEIWEQFIQARNFFYARKDADRVQKQQQFNAKIDNRIQQTKEFLEKLTLEIEDDRQKIIEFRSNVAELDLDNPKDLELKNHLEQLTNTIEAKLPNRERKIVEVSAQLQELIDKQSELAQGNSDKAEATND